MITYRSRVKRCERSNLTRKEVGIHSDRIVGNLGNKNVDGSAGRYLHIKRIEEVLKGDGVDAVLKHTL